MFITHVNPDFDAIASTYLLQRYLHKQHMPVVFVPAASEAYVFNHAYAVCDVGGVYEPHILRFDHHQMAHVYTSATELVYKYLENRNYCSADIQPLIQLITDCDNGVKHMSIDIGIHALLSAYKRTNSDDHAVYAYGVSLIEPLLQQFEHKATLRRSVREHTAYVNTDQRFIALVNGSSGVSYAAYDLGYDLVLFLNEQQPDTISVGIARAKHAEERINCVDIVNAIKEQKISAALQDELAMWHVDNRGFFAGRGTAKSPNTTAISAETFLELYQCVGRTLGSIDA